MRVLNVIHRYPPGIGGSETWCRNLCIFLAEKGVRTRVMAINMYHVAEAFDGNFLPDERIRLGREDFEKGVFIKRYKLWKPWENTRSGMIIRFLLYRFGLNKTQIGEIFKVSPHSFEMYRSLLDEIKNSDAVILHTLPYFHNLVSYLIAKLYGKIIIMVPHFHPTHPHYEKGIFYKMMNNCDAVITVSDYEKRYLVSKKVNPDKIIVTGNAIEIKDKDCYNEHETEIFKKAFIEKYKIKEDHKKVIFLGRKECYKGIFLLIEALSKLANEENIGLFLFLVGPDTPDFNKAYSKIGNLGRLKIIDFGEVSEEQKECLLRYSDVLALPSEFEAFGIVFLEAWEHEKPVIGADRGAMPEVIGRAGLCAEYGNVDDLKNKLKKLLFDTQIAEEMGRIGKEKVEKQYSVANVCGKVLKVLNKLMSKKKKRILIVSQLFPPSTMGGAEIVAYEQAKALKNMGFIVSIFAGKINNKLRQFKVNKEKGEFRTTRINLHGKDFEHYIHVKLNDNELRERFREALYEYNPEIVHFHNIYAFPFSMLDDCIDLNIPTVMTLHDYNGICPKNIFVRDNGDICSLKNGEYQHCRKNLLLEDGKEISVNKRNAIYIDYYNKINLLISPSAYLGERYVERGINRKRLKIINNGINTVLFKAIKKTKSRKIRFGYIGQIMWHKGIDNLLTAASLLNNEERKKVSFSITGTGDRAFLDYCLDMSKDLNFVNFLGEAAYAKIPNMFKEIDVLIVPSIWPENSPHSIIEAMASGTPVIASNVGGIPELIEDGINGFLFSYNSPESLVEKIRNIINDPKMIKKMRTACFIKAEKWDIGNQTKTIADLYEQIGGGV